MVERRDEITTTENFERRGISQQQRAQQQRMKEAQQEADERRASQGATVQRREDEQKPQGEVGVEANQAQQEAQQRETAHAARFRQIDEHVNAIFEIAKDMENSNELAALLDGLANVRYHRDVLHSAEQERQRIQRDVMKQQMQDDLKAVKENQENKDI